MSKISEGKERLNIMLLPSLAKVAKDDIGGGDRSRGIALAIQEWQQRAELLAGQGEGLSDLHREIAKKIGKGNVVRGIEIALDAWFESALVEKNN